MLYLQRLTFLRQNPPVQMILIGVGGILISTSVIIGNAANLNLAVTFEYQLIIGKFGLKFFQRERRLVTLRAFIFKISSRDQSFDSHNQFIKIIAFCNGYYGFNGTTVL